LTGRVSRWGDTLHGHSWIILNGSQATQLDLGSFILIIKMDWRDIQNSQLVGLKTFSRNKETCMIHWFFFRLSNKIVCWRGQNRSLGFWFSFYLIFSPFFPIISLPRIRIVGRALQLVHCILFTTSNKLQHHWTK